ncbi:MAG: RNA polymerase sigma factor, partial [Bacteroidales bacterium]|nr:RNA polymerase sigma factor [Bacteroidales bacterium]
MKPETTIKLIDKILNGDKQAYSQLFNRNYAYCLKKAVGIVNDSQVAKDLVQESFLQAYFNLAILSDKSAFKPWLGGIVNNVCHNYL